MGLTSFNSKPNVMLIMRRSGTGDVILERLDIKARPTHTSTHARKCEK